MSNAIGFITTVFAGVSVGVSNEYYTTFPAGITFGSTAAVGEVTVSPSGFKVGIVVNYYLTPTTTIQYSGLKLGASSAFALSPLPANNSGIKIGIVCNPESEVDQESGLKVGAIVAYTQGLSVDGGIKLGIAQSFNYYGAQCTFAQTGTTHYYWTFTGSGFTGDGTVFNAAFTLTQNPTQPCQWEWSDGLGNAILFTLRSPPFNDFFLDLTTVSLHYAQYRVSVTYLVNCNLPATLSLAVSTISGVSSIIMYPA